MKNGHTHPSPAPLQKKGKREKIKQKNNPPVLHTPSAAPSGPGTVIAVIAPRERAICYRPAKPGDNINIAQGNRVIARPDLAITSVLPKQGVLSPGPTWR